MFRVVGVHVDSRHLLTVHCKRLLYSTGKSGRFNLLTSGLAIAGLATAFVLLFWNVQLQQQLSRVQQSLSINGRVFVLTGTGVPKASARLYILPDLQKGELEVSGLPPLAANRTYQLWFARPGQPTETGGAFRVDVQGHINTSIVVPVPLGEVTAIAVTEEQLPGSLRPTGKHLLDAKL